MPQVHKRYNNNHQAHASKERCSKCGDSQHVQGFRYPANKYQSKIATSLVISAACATRKKSLNKKGSPVQEHIS